VLDILANRAYGLARGFRHAALADARVDPDLRRDDVEGAADGLLPRDIIPAQAGICASLPGSAFRAVVARPRGSTSLLRPNNWTNVMSNDVLSRLQATIRARRSESAEKSYTRQLLEAGPERCAKKLGEEAVETVIAGVGQSDDALRAEAADLLYHLLVLLEARGVALDDVLAVLESRTGQSGLAEKAARSS
jgi:phosphoribosyl-ATP pyrophosphohydrolase